MKFYSLLTAIFLALNYVHAEEIDVTQPIRMHQLMPREIFLSVLAVDPALPSNFVALKPSEWSSDWIYWGPEDVLQAYFKDQSSLSQPIIRFEISAHIAQSKMGVLDEQLIKEELAKESDCKEIATKFGKWGDYPYCLFSGRMFGKTIRMAYIGLNDANNGAVLLVNLIFPTPPFNEESALKLWDTFFEQTKKLPEPLFYKANGQELHVGHTIVNILARKIKVIAEKRKADLKIQFVVIPESDNIEFKFQKAFRDLMGGSWHYLEPLLKIEGAYIIDNGWMYYDMVTSVLIKEVDDFSPVPFLKKNVFVKTL